MRQHQIATTKCGQSHKVAKIIEHATRRYCRFSFNELISAGDSDGSACADASGWPPANPKRVAPPSSIVAANIRSVVFIFYVEFEERSLVQLAFRTALVARCLRNPSKNGGNAVYGAKGNKLASLEVYATNHGHAGAAALERLGIRLTNVSLVALK